MSTLYSYFWPMADQPSSESESPSYVCKTFPQHPSASHALGYRVFLTSVLSPVLHLSLTHRYILSRSQPLTALGRQAILGALCLIPWRVLPTYNPAECAVWVLRVRQAIRRQGHPYKTNS